MIRRSCIAGVAPLWSLLWALLPAPAVGQDPGQAADDAAFQVEGFEEPAGFDVEGFGEPAGFEGGDFPDVEIKTGVEVPLEETAEPYSFGGKLKSRLDLSPHEPSEGYGFNRKRAGLSQATLAGELFMDAKLSERVQGRFGVYGEVNRLYNDHQDPPLYPSDVREKDEQVLQFDETYLDWRPTNKLWLRLGNQINIWGTSENLRIVDVLNPRDQRLFEQEGPEETRLPNWASRISYSQDDWSADLIGIYEFRGDWVQGAGGDYDPFILFRTGQSAVDKDRGPSNYKPEVALRLSRRFHGADASFYAGNVYDKVSYADYRGFDPAAGGIEFQPDYDRMTFVGLSGSHVRGSWLFKTDMAYKHGLSFLRGDFFTGFNPATTRTNVAEKNTAEVMLGVDYNGLPNSSISLELAGRHLFDYDSALVDEQNTVGGVLQFFNDSFRDTLHTELRAIRLLNGAGYILNARLEYDLTDDLDLIAIYTEYISTDKEGFLEPYEDNDRLLLGVTYHF